MCTDQDPFQAHTLHLVTVFKVLRLLLPSPAFTFSQYWCLEESSQLSSCHFLKYRNTTYKINKRKKRYHIKTWLKKVSILGLNYKRLLKSLKINTLFLICDVLNHTFWTVSDGMLKPQHVEIQHVQVLVYSPSTCSYLVSLHTVYTSQKQTGGWSWVTSNMKQTSLVSLG